MEIKEWKANKKGKLISEVKKSIQTRSGLTCVHCDRQYDDDMCDSCFSVHLVNKFQESLIDTEDR